MKAKHQKQSSSQTKQAKNDIEGSSPKPSQKATNSGNTQISKTDQHGIREKPA
jgi:hypothetical protein